MKAAQPFILMVVQIGSTNRATFESTPNRSSALCIVTGNVAAELLVNKAISTAGVIARITFIGFNPRTTKNNGSTTKNCNTLPPNITATYLPIDDTTTPAETSADNCAAKARMPNGKAWISQWMNFDTRSCRPESPHAAVEQIKMTIQEMLDEWAKQPVYTVNDVIKGTEFVPQQLIGVGGGAPGLIRALGEAMALPVDIPATCISSIIL